jgi:hypothetical protein
LLHTKETTRKYQRKKKMKLKMTNVYLIEKKLLQGKESSILRTEFKRPECIDEHMFGWNVYITSKSKNTEGNHILKIETISQFQFTSEHNLSVDFKNEIFLSKFSELVYAAHCHHAALFIASATEFPAFEGQIPDFVTANMAKKMTERIMSKIEIPGQVQRATLSGGLNTARPDFGS